MESTKANSGQWSSLSAPEWRAIFVPFRRVREVKRVFLECIMEAIKVHLSALSSVAAAWLQLVEVEPSRVQAVHRWVALI